MVAEMRAWSQRYGSGSKGLIPWGRGAPPSASKSRSGSPRLHLPISSNGGKLSVYGKSGQEWLAPRGRPERAERQ